MTTIPTKPILPDDKQITALIQEAADYPLHVRIAAWYVASGGTEEMWLETAKRLHQLPDLFMVNIQNVIRDIDRGKYGENWRKTIPAIATIHLQRTTYLSAAEAEKYNKIREQVKQDFPVSANKNKKS